jgi:hypothetical protein
MPHEPAQAGSAGVLEEAQCSAWDGAMAAVHAPMLCARTVLDYWAVELAWDVAIAKAYREMAEEIGSYFAALEAEYAALADRPRHSRGLRDEGRGEFLASSTQATILYLPKSMARIDGAEISVFGDFFEFLVVVFMASSVGRLVKCLHGFFRQRMV